MTNTGIPPRADVAGVRPVGRWRHHPAKPVPAKLTAWERHEASMRTFPGIANLFQFVATFTVLVIITTEWTWLTIGFVILMAVSALGWGAHYERFREHFGIDQIPGMPPPVILAAAGAGFGFFGIPVVLYVLVEPIRWVTTPESHHFNLGGLGFSLVLAWWYSQQVYDFFDDHAIPA